jgi:DNA-binding SARP family transcriptional activator
MPETGYFATMGETEVRPRYSILGPLRVRGPDGTSLQLGGRRPRELLAMLLLHPNEVISKERLVDVLWGASASEGATITLRTHVSAVRRVLAAAGAPDALAARSGGYVLVLDRDDLDAEVFERLVERGQEALGLADNERATTLLRLALALWGGDALSDLGPPDFAATTIARLDELRLVAEETLLSAELALGRHREAVHRLQALVTLHPFRERFVAQLMVALYRSGRQADALAAYASTKQLLANELGLDPGPELQDLETAMLRQDPLLLGNRPPSADRREPGNRPGTRPPDAVLTALRRTPIVGRPAELLALETRWRSVVAGGAGVALVSGSAGIGKSRLIAELAHAAAADDGTVLVARCDDPSVPYQSLASAFRASGEVVEALRNAPEPVRQRMAPLLPDDSEVIQDPTGAGQQSALPRAVEWLMVEVAAHAPVLLVVEEAERIDRATAVLLRHLSRHLPSRSMLVVAYRDPPGSRHPPLLELVGDGGVADLADRLMLTPLGVEDLAELVSGHTGTEPADRFVESLWARTGGNPFFATEVLRDLAPADVQAADDLDVPVPSAVRDVLRHRLSTLPQETRGAIGAAAVLGREVELLLLGRVLDRAEEQLVEALEPAVARGFLVESGGSWAGGYAFPHELMREAVYAETTPPRRERLHRRVADALLTAQVPTDADVIAAAVHLRHAGGAADPVEVGQASLRASEAAARGLAWAEAVQHAEAALPFVDRGAPPGDQAAARVRVAMLRLRSGHDYARAITLLDDALVRQLGSGDPRAAGTTHSRIGSALCMHHSVMDIPRALEHFDAAERLRPDARQEFHLHRGRMQAAMFGLRTALLGEAVGQAEELAQQSGRADLASYAGWGAGYHAANRGEIALAFQHFERAWQAAHSLGDAYVGWLPANAAAHVATELLLDPAAGRAWCRRGLAQPRFASFEYPHEAVADQLARAMAAMGELDAAYRATDGLPAHALAHRVLGFYRGDWESAAREGAAALARDREAGNQHDALFNARRLAESLILLGESARAEEVLGEALEVAAAGPQVPSEVWLRARLAQLVAATRPAEAETHVQRCEEIVTDEGWAGLGGEVALSRGVVDGCRGRLHEAESAFDLALAAFTEFQLPWRQADARLEWARLLDDAGQEGQAAVQRARARAIYGQLGAAERWVRRGGAAEVPNAGPTGSQRAARSVEP